jgi:two-component system KDP operon response regulator KdpE
MSGERVLVVQSDPKLQRLLQAQLLALEYAVQVANRGEDALIVAAEFEPELILLANVLPGINGVETIRRLREWTRTPVIVLDDQADEHRTVEALDAGADDYVRIPFRMPELLVRMRAVLRRVRERARSPAVAALLTFRNLTLDLTNRRVLLNGKPLRLTPIEYDLLRVLILHAGRVLTHRELLTKVWGAESSGDTQYLHVIISQLRRKLQPRSDGPRHILTEPGVGYQFAAAP